ncbi:MAG TPA: hypothetical protein PKL03_01825 [Candidatus Omnitrophota bacterium]|nr:hypothetical protein [Candidatus Omnitrophota bacterium]
MRFISYVVAVIIGLFIATSAYAQTTYYWDGGDGSNNYWENSDNWDPDGMPGVDDDAIITDSSMGYYAVDINSAQEINSLTFDQGMALNILSEGADLMVRDNAYFGYDFSGYGYQEDGRFEVQNQLRFADMPDSYGEYDLMAGALVSKEMVLGSEGYGYMAHWGGTNTVKTGLGLGMSGASSAMYELNGFNYPELTAGHEVIASRSAGYDDPYWGPQPGAYFIQSGGVNEIIGDNAVYNTEERRLEVREGSFSDLVIGDVAGSFGEYSLYSGTLHSRTAIVLDESGSPIPDWDGYDTYIGGNEYIGFDGRGRFVHESGSNLLDQDLVLGAGAGSLGEYYFSNGYLAVNLDDHRPEVFIGLEGSGYFQQDGGTFDAQNSGVYLGVYESGHGVYNMTGGWFGAAGMALGEWGGTGEFNHSGGTVAMTTHPLDLARQDNSIGIYRLSGTGLLNVSNNDLVVGTRGHGEFWQSGGTANVNGNVWISATPVENGSTGEYHISGGTVNAGTVNNFDRLYYSGGTLNASIANSQGAVVELSGEGTRIVSGTLHNYGTVRATDTTVQINGEMYNFNEMSSEGSAWYLQDFKVDVAGYIAAGGKDQFNVAGVFQSRSAMAGEWMTDNARLIFNGASHDVVFNAVDMGGVNAGYVQNFAWGTVDFGGDTFYLKSLDEAGTQFGALYVETIAGIDYINDDLNKIYMVDNFNGDGNIYYMAQANPWLEGKTYAFASGTGQLRPVGVVPEPVSMVLFVVGSGVLGAAAAKRRVLVSKNQLTKRIIC